MAKESFSRRDALKAGGAGLAALFLAACGGGPKAVEPTVTTVHNLIASMTPTELAALRATLTPEEIAAITGVPPTSTVPASDTPVPPTNTPEAPTATATSERVENPTTLKELVAGTDFIVGLPIFTDVPKTFETVRNHSSAGNLPTTMGHLVPNENALKTGLNSRQLDGGLELAAELGKQQIYISHLVDPMNMVDTMPWIFERFEQLKASNGIEEARKWMSGLVTGYVEKAIKHIDEKTQNMKQVIVSVLGESGVVPNVDRPEGWDPLVEMMGADYPEQIFSAARRGSNRIKLAYTDTNNFQSRGDQGACTPVSKAMVDRLYKTGKMDVLCLESILNGATAIDYADMDRVLTDYGDVPFFLPEHEISVKQIPGSREQKWAKQAEIETNYLGVFAKRPNWMGVTFHAIGDTSFLMSQAQMPWAGPEADSSLFDPNTLAPKPAYQAAFSVIAGYLGRA